MFSSEMHSTQINQIEVLFDKNTPSSWKTGTKFNIISPTLGVVAEGEVKSGKDTTLYEAGSQAKVDLNGKRINVFRYEVSPYNTNLNPSFGIRDGVTSSKCSTESMYFDLSTGKMLSSGNIAGMVVNALLNQKLYIEALDGTGTNIQSDAVDLDLAKSSNVLPNATPSEILYFNFGEGARSPFKNVMKPEQMAMFYKYLKETARGNRDIEGVLLELRNGGVNEVGLSLAKMYLEMEE